MNQSWRDGRRRFLQQAAFATAAIEVLVKSRRLTSLLSGTRFFFMVFPSILSGNFCRAAPWPAQNRDWVMRLVRRLCSFSRKQMELILFDSIGPYRAFI